MSTTQTEFYVVDGGTMRRDAQSYVERKADEDLYASLVAGRYCHVLTSHQMGKSSLMVRTAETLRAAGVAVVDFELTRIGQNLTAEQWYNGLLSVLRNKLDPTRLGLDAELKAFWRAHMHLGPQQRLMRAIREVVLERLKSKLVIFVDEIDYVRSLPFSTDEFFAGIREFYNRRAEDAELDRLTFCLLGVATPGDLIRDPRTTPFNISTRIELTDFSALEAAPLVRGLGRDKVTGSRLLERILYWTGGHPYLTQVLCLSVSKDAGITNSSGVDRQCRELFLSSRSLESDVNIRDVRDRILHSNQADRASLLDLYQKVRNEKPVPDDEKNPLVSVLRLSGVSRSVEGRLKVRNRVYQRAFDKAWVLANMPDAERQRQRIAYRKGVLLAATVAAIIIVALGGLAAAAVQQRNRAEQQREIARQETNRAETALAQVKASEAKVLRESAAKDEARQLAEKERNRATLETKRTKEALATAETQRVKASAQTKIAEAEMAKAQEQTRRAEDQRQVAESARNQVTEVASRNRRLLYDANMNLSQQAWEQSNVSGLLDLLNKERPAAGENDLRGFEWYYLWRTSHTGLPVLAPILAPTEGIYRNQVLSPDGKFVATFTAGGKVLVREINTGRNTLTLQVNATNIASMTFSTDGRRIVTGCTDHTARVLDAETGQELQIFRGHTGTVDHVAISADGRWIATSGRTDVASTTQNPFDQSKWVLDDTVRAWDTRTGEELLKIDAPPQSILNGIYDLAISNNGLVVVARNDTARVWDVSTKQEKFALRGHKSFISAVAFSPDGGRIITSSWDGTARLWDATTGVGSLVLTGDSGPDHFINSVAFSANGTRIVTGGSDKKVRVWEAETGRQLFTFKGHETGVRTVVFSADGRLVIASGEDGSVKIWPTDAQPDPLTITESRDEIRSAAFSPDEMHIVTFDTNQTVKVWEAKTGREEFAIKEASCPGAFSLDGKHVVTGSEDGTVRAWDLATRQATMTFKASADPIACVAFSPSGALIITGSYDITKVWDTLTGRNVLTLKREQAPIRHVAFSSNGKRILTANEGGAAHVWNAVTGENFFIFKGVESYPVFSFDGSHVATFNSDLSVSIWDTTTGQELFRIKRNFPGFSTVAFSADGSRILTGDRDHTAKVWDLADGHEMFTLRGHSGWIMTAAFSVDNKYVITGGTSDYVNDQSDHLARVWDLTNGAEVLTLKGHANSVNSVAFSRDGRHIVTASVDNTAKIWNMTNGQEDLTLRGETGGPTGDMYSVAFSPDGKRIVTGTSGTAINVREAATGRILLSLTGFSGTVKKVTFSNDGKLIGAVSPASAAKVWDSETGKVLLSLRGAFTSIDISPDNTRVVTGREERYPDIFQGTAIVWDMATRHELVTLRGHGAEIFSAAFSPDGSRIVTASADGTARIWEATTGKHLLALVGHRNRVLSASFSFDGKLILTTSNDGSARIWDGYTGHLVRDLKDPNISSAAFSKNAKRVVTGSEDGTAKIWDIETGQVILTFKGHTKSIGSVAFSPDGARIATVSDDETAKIWSAETSGELGVVDLYRLGIGYGKDQDFSKAIDTFTKLLNLSPKNVEALVARGFAYFQVKNIDAAISDCSMAVKIDPAEVSAHFCSAYAFHLKGNLNSAQVEYDEVLRLEPANVAAHYNLACIYSLRSVTYENDLNGGRRREEDRLVALEHLEKAIKYGFRDWEHLKVDTDLDPIRSDPRFLQVIRDH